MRVTQISVLAAPACAAYRGTTEEQVHEGFSDEKG
jgi:hypothetical protein